MSADAGEICKALGGHWYGPYGLAFCPVHENTRTPALSIKDGDNGTLLVYCFAGCAGADVLAALRARGLLAGHFVWRPDRREIERRKAEEESERRRRVELARRCWFESGSISGTLAERYLRVRGITCQLPPTLRFHPSCWNSVTAKKLPAMVAAVGIGRKVDGVHRTYLAEPGVKAFDNAKMMLGSCAGGATRLSGGLGPLVVAEGVETRRSASCRAFRTPACGSGRRSAPAVWLGWNCPATPASSFLRLTAMIPGVRRRSSLPTAPALPGGVSASWTARPVEIGMMCGPRRRRHERQGSICCGHRAGS